MKDRYFGFIRAVMIGQVTQSESIQLQLLVYPLDFVEFCELMASLNDYTQYTSSPSNPNSNHKEAIIQQAPLASAQVQASNSQNNQYGKFKWKLRFDTYKDHLPGMSGVSTASIYGTARNGMMYAYYNDYINTCIRFVDQRNRLGFEK